MAQTDTPLVSVVVSARGNTANVRSLLNALAAQTLSGGQMEAVVVDNDLPGPVRPVADAVRDGDWPFPVRVLYEPTPGLSAGRNRGICAARGRYIAITDPDIIPEPGWLQALVDAIEEERVFAVGGRTTVQYPGGQAVALTKALRECHGAVDWPEGREPAVWPYWVTGCNLLFHRQTALDSACSEVPQPDRRTRRDDRARAPRDGLRQHPRRRHPARAVPDRDPLLHRVRRRGRRRTGHPLLDPCGGTPITPPPPPAGPYGRGGSRSPDAAPPPSDCTSRSSPAPRHSR